MVGARVPCGRCDWCQMAARHCMGQRLVGFGDGDPTEWGRVLPDGREVMHPPWGPVEVRPARKPFLYVAPARSRWRWWPWR